MTSASRPYSLASGEGKTLPTPAGGQVTIKVRGSDSADRVSILEFEVPVGGGPRLHVHEATEECIYVLHGELRVQLGDEFHRAPTGSCVFIPRQLPHRFENIGADAASLLAVYTPSGIEEFFESFARGRGPSGGSVS